MGIYRELIQAVKDNNLTPKDIAKLKRKLCQKYKIKRPPTNFEVMLNAKKEELEKIRSNLLLKPIRTQSGVTPVAIMTKPSSCPHGKCIYCPGGLRSHYGDVPQSYTGHEPTTMRAIRNNYDSYRQVFNRLEQYIATGHPADKIELIIMGGTFPALPEEYQDEFICYALKAINDFSEMFMPNGEICFEKFKIFFELPGEIGNKRRAVKIKSKIEAVKGKSKLAYEQMRNETASIKCVALCIETKPDWAMLKHGDKMLSQGCTRIEIGVQSVYDDVLKKIKRGHNLADTKKSFAILKDLGFKISAHYMPGLPLTDELRDIEGFRELFDNSALKPDMLKIYPCMVAPGTELHKEYASGEFKPLGAEEAAKRIAVMKEIVPEYCRIQRIQRDVPTKMWAAGAELTNLRQFIHQKYQPKCKCIRCREPKNKKIDLRKVKIKVCEYEASNGREFFISADTGDTLLGFCRLRYPSRSLRKEITRKSGLIRELHVYGQATPLGKKGKVQHRGLGKTLLAKAEEIAFRNGRDKMVVISGMGVREYYRKLGYKREGVYMVKDFR